MSPKATEGAARPDPTPVASYRGRERRRFTRTTPSGLPAMSPSRGEISGIIVFHHPPKRTLP
jgi:hypothetical protein